MNLSILDKAQKLWKDISKNGEPGQLTFNLEIHKKLLSIFHVGDYYYYIFDCKNARMDYVSEEISHVLGCKPENFTIPFLIDAIHPEDLSWFINFENTVTDFFTKLPVEKILNYKVRYDYRIRSADGTYKRILQQVVSIQTDENGGVLRTLGVHTDISHIKTEGRPVLSFIGLNGEPSFHNIDIKKALIPVNEVLSKREKEILMYMAEGKQSREISIILNISKNTVDKHRKNMLGKNGFNTSVELVAYAIREGWI